MGDFAAELERKQIAMDAANVGFVHAVAKFREAEARAVAAEERAAALEQVIRDEADRTMDRLSEKALRAALAALGPQPTTEEPRS
jgi:hypothetical protein